MRAPPGESSILSLETWVAYHRNEVFEKRLEGRSPLDFLIEKLESLLGN